MCWRGVAIFRRNRSERLDVRERYCVGRDSGKSFAKNDSESRSSVL